MKYLSNKEKIKSIINIAFLSSFLLNNKIITTISFLTWIAFLLYCIKSAVSKMERTIYIITLILAVVIFFSINYFAIN